MGGKTVHYGDVFLICTVTILGSSLGLFAGLVAGMSVPDTMLTIGAFAGLFEGIVRGFSFYGVVGALVGGPLGLVVIAPKLSRLHWPQDQAA